jgi:hypothetical protein
VVVSFNNEGTGCDQVPYIQRTTDASLDAKKKLLLKLRHEELRNSEIALRLEEVNDRLARRDSEYDDVNV